MKRAALLEQTELSQGCWYCPITDEINPAVDIELRPGNKRSRHFASGSLWKQAVIWHLFRIVAKLTSYTKSCCVKRRPATANDESRNPACPQSPNTHNRAPATLQSICLSAQPQHAGEHNCEITNKAGCANWFDNPPPAGRNRSHNSSDRSGKRARKLRKLANQCQSHYFTWLATLPANTSWSISRFAESETPPCK